MDKSLKPEKGAAEGFHFASPKMHNKLMAQTDTQNGHREVRGKERREQFG